MLSPKLKLKYELHYWDTDVTGRDENDWESVHLKFIYFPKDGKWGDRPYRLAVGLEWIKDLGDRDKGIGSGADQIAPLFGVALKLGDTMVVPLVQHFPELQRRRCEPDLCPFDRHKAASGAVLDKTGFEGSLRLGK